MKMGTVLSPYRYDAGARHALQSSRNAAVPRGFEWHMLAGGDGTAWLAFLNTVRTERFDQVLALRPLLPAHREGRVGQGPRKRKARTSGLAKPSEPAPHERAALDAHLAPKKQVCARCARGGGRGPAHKSEIHYWRYPDAGIHFKTRGRHRAHRYWSAKSRSPGITRKRGY